MFHAGAAASILRAARQAKVKAKESSAPKRKGSASGSRRPSAAGGRRKSSTLRKKTKPKNPKKLNKQASSLSMLSRDDNDESTIRECATPAADRLAAEGATVFSPEEAETLYQMAFDLQEAKRMLNNHSDIFKQRLDTLDKADYRAKRFKVLHGKHQLIWRIDNVRQRLTEAESGTRRIIYSPIFMSHPRGYRMLCSICPNGDGKAQGQFVSLFFCIMKGEYDGLLAWPFVIPVTFSVLDQSDDSQKSNVTRTFVPNPVKENELFLGRPAQQRNMSIGFPRFMPLSELMSGKYIIDDRLYIKVHLDDKTIESISYT